MLSLFIIHPIKFSLPVLNDIYDNTFLILRFEVFKAATMKNGVFWDVTTCGSCKNRCFGGT
jgi:hypothetical protein